VKIPAGWRVVKRGCVHPGDQYASVDVRGGFMAWRLAGYQEIGTEVAPFYCVRRRLLKKKVNK
jgi:hypothetical protein